MGSNYHFLESMLWRLIAMCRGELGMVQNQKVHLSPLSALSRCSSKVAEAGDGFPPEFWAPELQIK